MSVTVLKVQSNGNEDSTIVTLARVKHTDGTDITTSNISTITFSVHKKSDDSQVIAPTGLVPLSSFIHVPPITDGIRWGIIDDDESVQGFNFEHVVPETAFPDGPEVYEIVYTFTTTSGRVFTFKVEHRVDNTFVS